MKLRNKSMQPSDTRYRWQIVFRSFTAIFGGYALANTSAILLTYLLPMSRVDAVTTSMLISFAIYAGAVMWVFSHRSLLKSIGGIWTLAIFFFAIITLIKFTGTTP